MKKDHKQGTIDALNKYYSRQEKERVKALGPKRRNAKPEKEVEKVCLEWMRAVGWSVEIYEAKSTWSPEAGAWINQSMKAGTCDCMGSTGDGHSVAIEFKAPGCLSSFNSIKRTRQREFIVRKIESNCFACVTDSLVRLQTIYGTWLDLKQRNFPDLARQYLMSQLPKKKSGRDDDSELFPD